MVFEVGDLSQASPATVSRCGIVYIDPSDLGWLPYVHSWANRLQNDVIIRSSELKNYLVSLFETYINEGFLFINKHCLAPIKQVQIFFHLPIFQEKIENDICILIPSQVYFVSG